MSAAYLQGIGTVFGGLAAFISAVMLVLNRTRISTWFKRQSTLIAERNVAVEAAMTSAAHVASALASMNDYKNSVEALRVQSGMTSARLKELEQVRPIYDAFVLWVPKVLAYIATIETAAREQGGNPQTFAMPPLPAVLRDHLATRDTA